MTMRDPAEDGARAARADRRFAMTITFSTREYEFSHGRKPRGRGGWAFTFDDSEKIIWTIPSSMTYADARKWARDYARANGHTFVSVCS